MATIDYDLSMDDYLAIDAVSSSALKSAMVSALECWVKHIDPNRDKERHTTPLMEEGSAYHDMLLEGPDVFAQRNVCEFIATPDMLITQAQLKDLCAQRGIKTSGTKLELCQRLLMNGVNEGLLEEIAKQEWRNKINGRRVLKSHTFRDIKIAREVLNRMGIAEMMEESEGKPEVSITWQDKKLNALCKIRPDFLTPDGNIIALKTVTNPMKKPFDRLVAEKIFYEGYHVEAAFYRRGLKAAGYDPKFFFLFVERGPVPNVDFRAFEAAHGDDEHLKAAERSLDVAMEIYMANMGKFGKDQPWVGSGTVKRYTTTDFPSWVLEADLK